jgi:hypothetical protein
MAGLLCIAQTSEVALVAATAKTILQLTAPTNQRLKVKRWGVFFDGIANDAEPVEIRLLRQTTVGTGGDVLTPVLQVAGSETIQTSGLSDIDVAEPTAGDVVDVAEVHPQSGYEVIIPFDMPIEIPGGGRMGIECIAPAAVNVRAKMIFEE